jgi:hypothetical protein
VADAESICLYRWKMFGINEHCRLIDHTGKAKEETPAHLHLNVFMQTRMSSHEIQGKSCFQKKKR